MAKQLSDEARKARYEYVKQWKKRNPDKVKTNVEYVKQWKKRNPDKVKEYTATYWERKAQKLSVTDNVTDNVTDKSKRVTVTDKRNKCVECGNLFVTKRTDSKFCSPACKQKYHRNKAH